MKIFATTCSPLYINFIFLFFLWVQQALKRTIIQETIIPWENFKRDFNVLGTCTFTYIPTIKEQIVSGICATIPCSRIFSILSGSCICEVLCVRICGVLKFFSLAAWPSVPISSSVSSHGSWINKLQVKIANNSNTNKIFETNGSLEDILKLWTQTSFIENKVTYT